MRGHLKGDKSPLDEPAGMAQIGIVHGDQESFPLAVLEALNSHRKGCCRFLDVESLNLEDREFGGWDTDIVLDLFSRKMPFLSESLYLVWQFSNTKVFNDPKNLRLHNRATARQLAKLAGLRTAASFLLPAKDYPANFPQAGFENLRSPFNWETMFKATGPYPQLQSLSFEGESGILVQDLHTLWRRYNETGTDLHELISPPSSDTLFRVYVVGEQSFTRRLDPLTRYLLPPSKISRAEQTALQKAAKSVLRNTPMSICAIDLGLGLEGVEYIDMTPYPDLEWWTLGEKDFAKAVRGAVKLLRDYLPPETRKEKSKAKAKPTSAPKKSSPKKRTPKKKGRS